MMVPDNTSPRRAWNPVCLWTFFFLLGTSPVASAEPNPARDTGRAVYAEHCRVCHGERGDGQTFAANVLDPPPRNFTAEPSRRELTRQRMLHSVTHGRKGTAMMPWQTNLTPEQIRAVVAFIRAEFMGLRE
jgi:mono/diheme cytochrome c family protein